MRPSRDKNIANSSQAIAAKNIIENLFNPEFRTIAFISEVLFLPTVTSRTAQIKDKIISILRSRIIGGEKRNMKNTSVSIESVNMLLRLNFTSTLPH